MDLYIGYDVGSISVNRAILDREKKIIDILPYTRHFGDPIKIIKNDINFILAQYGCENFKSLYFTGSGAKDISRLLGYPFLNEIEAIINSVKYFHGDTKTVIEIGGQDSKFIDLADGDYAMNELCAAGTGSFLDQQASRFGLSIEEFSRMALKSTNPSTIAGRCSVFAKSDMIHLQQEAASDEDIAKGLCYAMARSFKSGIAKGKKFNPPVIFCGGVSYNEAMVEAFSDTLGVEINIPEYRASIGAIGSALKGISDEQENGKKEIERDSSRAHEYVISTGPGKEINAGSDKEVSMGIGSGIEIEIGTDKRIDLEELKQKLEIFIRDYAYKAETFKPLVITKSELPPEESVEYVFDPAVGKTPAYIGIDVGSISTNVVAVDKDKKLIAKCYLRTAGRPIEAVRKGIDIIGRQIGEKIEVKGVGTTGSGRYLIGDLVGADIVINEITAQATAAADIDSSVDTIFEIGGQDSKYISLEDGVVVDFEMNKVCAAGTGSFLEEQSERFDIKIEDFGDIALKSANPINLGERCTVFMETNVYSHYQKGASIEDILAGLAYSIAMNYINRVVGRKKIGNKIFFQGAVAFNKSVIAAFENYTGKKIIVPRHHEVTGAIGTAIAALKSAEQSTTFRGFEEISKINYTHSSFECNGCPNHCEIKKISVKNQKPLFYGGRCEKYEKSSRIDNGLPDYFEERENLLLNSYRQSKLEKDKLDLTATSLGNKINMSRQAAGIDGSPEDIDVDIEGNKEGNIRGDKEKENATAASDSRLADSDGRLKVGMPYSMLTHEFFPFWQAYFEELGFNFILSDTTNKKIINDGVQFAVSETCFPMKTLLGHVINLLDKNVDFIFLPTTRDMPTKKTNIKGDRTGSYPCPFIQGSWSIVKSSIDTGNVKILKPILNFSFREFIKEKQLMKLGLDLGKNKKEIRKSIKKAHKVQSIFYKSLKERGRQVLAEIGEDEIAIVVSSRSYNSCDRAISMDVPRKLKDLGFKVIPLDYISVGDINLSADWPNLYWEFGDRILSAAQVIKKDKRLYPVYITNFGCGPDSFILQYFEREMNKPFLKLEVDEHSAGAGVITRCEAFADSLRNIKSKEHASIAAAATVTIPAASNIPNSAAATTLIEETTSASTPAADAPAILQRNRNMDSKVLPDSANVNTKTHAVFKKDEGRVIYIPFMSDGAIVLKHAFRSAGIAAEMLHSDDETLRWGRRYTLGKECYPFIITTGDIIKTLKNNDPAKSAFLMPQTSGPCRFGQYNKMQKIIINELGYGNVPIIAPGAPEGSQFYREYDMNGKNGFRLLQRGIFGIITVDYLNKMLRQTRPYEIRKGETDKIYESYVDQVCRIVEFEPISDILKKMVEMLKKARISFEKIEVKKIPKPLIGVVGEIFVRNHPFSNNEIIRTIEAMGGEVEIPTIGEWPYHTSATRNIDIKVKQTDVYLKILKFFRNSNNGYELSQDRETLFELSKDFVNGTKNYLTNRIQNRYLKHYDYVLAKPLKGFFRDEREADIYEVWENAEPYIIKWFGEAALSVGKSVDWIKNGADGIINVLPFTCIPGNIVNAISKSIKEDYGTPWLNLAFDGLEQGTTETRIEAFMYQARQHLINKENLKDKSNKF